ncbi:MAG: sensor histidine kinase [Pseudolabrys sp.]
MKVEANEAAPVNGNRELVSQALANLVDNAIKYAEPQHPPEGGTPVNGATPEIVVRALKDGDRILLTVTDNGPGIPEADRGRAVERFVRLEQSRSKPGSGLGLSLASAVARLHGGELTLGRQSSGSQKRHCIAARRPGTDCRMRPPAGKKATKKTATKVLKRTVRKAAPEAGDSAPAQPRGASLAGRIVTAPRLLNAKLARAAMAEWLGGLTPAGSEAAQRDSGQTSYRQHAAGEPG